ENRLRRGTTILTAIGDAGHDDRGHDAAREAPHRNRTGPASRELAATSADVGGRRGRVASLGAVEPLDRMTTKPGAAPGVHRPAPGGVRRVEREALRLAAVDGVEPRGHGLMPGAAA